MDAVSTSKGMIPMKTALSILHVVRESPGTSKEDLKERFGLSKYRLRRALAKISRVLSDEALVHDDEHGVWVVDVSPDRCRGMEWHGWGQGGFRQCSRAPEFDDGCCYEHSSVESAEMAAFQRRLEVLCAPCGLTPYNLGQINLTTLERMVERLRGIVPKTRKEALTKKRYGELLGGAVAFAHWKDRMRSRAGEHSIPFELFERHRRSSVNPFEYSLQKHFATLEVTANASREEVVKAWRKLARRYHPDSEGGDEERMKVINLAKERIFRLRRWE